MPALNIGPRFVSAGQLEEEEQQRLQEQEEQQRPVVSDLANYVQQCWSAAQRSKTDVTNSMLRSQRMLNGEYEPDKLEKIRQQQGGSTLYMRLADEKSAAAKAWICDTLLPPDEEPWGCEGTPIPDLPDQYKQQLQQQAEAELRKDLEYGVVTSEVDIQERIDSLEAEVYEHMRKITKEVESAVEAKVKDIVVESNWREALKGCIDDMVDYKAGFLKGPVFRYGRKMVWNQGKMEPQDVIRLEFESPSPFDVYPSPTARDTDDGYLIEKHSLRRSDLVAMRGVEGYSEEAIDAVLRDYGNGGLRQWLYTVPGESTHETLSGRSNTIEDPEGVIDALQFWGRVQGLWLLEHGVEPGQIGDVLDEYDVEVWLIGSHVIKCVINEDPMGERKYWKISFRPRKNQFWGDGVLDLIADVQDMCNASARNLVNNMGITSGPQIGVDTDAMPAGEKITNIKPLKIWQFSMKDVNSSTRAPIWFFQPKSVINELIKTYEFFSREADNKTGIPKYAYGQGGDGSGASDTASGFSMMMNNASRNIKQVIRNLDRLIKGSIDGVLLHLKMTDDDPVWQKTDVNIKAKGTTSLIAKEQAQVRRNEFLNIVLQSPEVLQIIGQDGLANILRPMTSDLNLEAPDIVPTKEEMKRIQHVAQQAGSGQEAQGQQGPPEASQGQQPGQGQQQKQQPGQGPPAAPRAPETDQAGAVQGGRDAKIF